jgi:DNA-binding MarR family transcriptional regulator
MSGMARTQRSEAERLYLFVQHLARELRGIDVALGLSSARLSAMVSLRFHGADNVGALAATERVSRPAMTRLVRDMERDGLVRRLPDTRDGRGVKVELTRKGAELVSLARSRKIAFVAERLKRVPLAERGTILHWLDKLNDGP